MKVENTQPLRTAPPQSWHLASISTLCLAMVMLASITGYAHGSLVSSGSFTALHHSGTGPRTGENSHYYYFPSSGDGHHFAWDSATPSSPGTVTVKYDFRNQNGFANQIDADQQAAAVSALDAWSAATGGKVVFVQDTAADASQIINIGTGDLAAMGYTSEANGVLGWAGGTFTHAGSTHSISSAAVWLDAAETWDTVIGNGDPGGGYDYFTVVAQEIGHALGLGHTAAPGSIMNAAYGGELTALSALDVDHITSVYGVAAVPLPGGVWLLASGFVWLLYLLRRPPLPGGREAVLRSTV